MTTTWSPCEVCGKPVLVPGLMPDDVVYCGEGCWREANPDADDLEPDLPPLRQPEQVGA